MVKIEINDIPIEAQDGQMVIEAADDAGVTIPRFCYHKKLSIAANCRMCLVEVEKANKPMPACATPVTEGMKVYTRSPKALAAQKSVMEFLLINHPLDCPICDQGGECDLQEMSMGFGPDISRFTEGKRVVPDPDLGPLIATDMTRCIHCTRCVRFGEEIAGVRELGGTGRGEDTRIGTYVQHTVSSELSGNVIDLCPVGALTSKPYRYSARPWELVARRAVSPHDGVGANLRVDTRQGRVMRVLPAENEAVNETWIADRDRFSYLGLYAEDRLTAPMVKEGGGWKTVDWDTAVTRAAEAIKGVRDQHGGDALAAWGADWASVEELYLLQRLMRGIGCGNIDHRLRQSDFRGQENAPAFPSLGQKLADLDGLEAFLLVGGNVRKEQPLIGHRLRQAALAGAWAGVVNPVRFDLNLPAAREWTAAPTAMVTELAGVAAALLERSGAAPPAGYPALLDGAAVAEGHREAATKLAEAGRGAVLLGAIAAQHPAAAELEALAALIGRLADVPVGHLGEGGNSAGAWLAGAVPHRDAGGRPAGIAGHHWRQAAADGLRGLLLFGVEPEYDSADPAAAVAAMAGADAVVALTPYAGAHLYAHADVLLPTTLFPESAGTWVNAEGRWQDAAGCARAPGEARPGWKVLRVLGNLLDVEGFEYVSSEEVRDELRAACTDVVAVGPAEAAPAERLAPEAGLSRIGNVPIYAVDPLVRRSPALQKTPDADAAVARLHPETAQRLGLDGAERVRVRQGGGSAELPLVVDEAVAAECVQVPAGLTETAALGAAYGPVELERL